MVPLNDFRLVIDLFDSIAILDEAPGLLFQGSSLKKLLSNQSIDLTSIQPGESDDPFLSDVREKIHQVKASGNYSSILIPDSELEFLLVPFPDRKIIFGLKPVLLHLLKLEHELKERVKELNCLYHVSKESNNSYFEFINNSVLLIEKSFQYPSETIVNIFVSGRKFGKHIPLSEWYEACSVEVKSGNEIRGKIAVWLKQGVGILSEEIQLTEEMARKISRLIEKEERTANLNKQKEILSRKNEALLKLTEECYQKRENLNTIFRTISDTMIVIDREFNLKMSNKAELGDSGKCYKQLFNLNERCPICPSQKVFETTQDAQTEEKYGDRYFTLRSFPILGTNGTPEQVLEVCRDITDQKRMELQLFQSYKLASLGKLVAGVAHEINNPNTFILGNLKIVKEGLDDLLPLTDNLYEEKKDLKIARLDYRTFRDNISVLVTDMINGAERTKKIVADLRNFAKKDDAGLADEVDLNDIIKNHLTLTRKHVKKHAEMEFNLRENIPHFRGNINKIEQVFLNLIINATDSMDNKEGTLRITTDYDQNTNEVILIISDNGCGIEESNLKNIFDPFFTTKRDKGGVGLGLSITYSIIQEHGGKIDVESKKGVGTSFILKFPGSR